jgi:hypothetical protein
MTSRLRGEQVLLASSTQHVDLVHDGHDRTGPGAESDRVRLVLHEIDGNPSATEGSEGFGPVVAIEDYEILVRHENRFLQDPVPADLVH